MLLITNEMSLKEIIQNWNVIDNKWNVIERNNTEWNVIDNKWNVIERNNTEVKCYW